MSFEQDWKPVVFRKTQPKTFTQHAEGHKQTVNILSDEPEAPKILGKDIGHQILQARNNKRMTQVELARKINVTSNLIRDYETGNVVPEKRILRLIGTQLGIKINY